MEPEPQLDVWRCPVDGCGHVMKKQSAGRRAHMIRNHRELVIHPCPSKCSHGCKTCVPDKVLFQGLAASISDTEDSIPILNRRQSTARSSTATQQPSRAAPRTPRACSSTATQQASRANPRGQNATSNAEPPATSAAAASASSSSASAAASAASPVAPAARVAAQTSRGRKRPMKCRVSPQRRLRKLAVLRKGSRAKQGQIKGLPDDVALEHESRCKIRVHKSSKDHYFHYRGGPSGDVYFQVTFKMAGDCQETCGQIARLCYEQFMQGSTKLCVKQYRDELCSSVRNCSENRKSTEVQLTPKKRHASNVFENSAPSGLSNSNKRTARKTSASHQNQDPDEQDEQEPAFDGKDEHEPAFDDTDEQGLQPDNSEPMDLEAAASEHCRLEAAALYALLRQGAATKEAVLRGVDQECQAELLDLIERGPQSPTSANFHMLEVPLGVARNGNDEMDEGRAGAFDPWAQEALERGIDWPEDFCPLPRPVCSNFILDGLGPSDAFSLGVIVGPSGSGVTRLLLQLASSLELPAAPHASFRSDQAIASQFEDAVSTLPTVGLNNVPAWMRPYHVLSNGQQQRARLGMYLRSGAVIDDFGSGIGQKEVQSVANAVGKLIRKQHLSQVLIGTHSPDAVAFLQPDFVMCVNGHWATNPNPLDRRCASVELEPSFMGRLQQPSDVPLVEAADPYEYASETWPGAVKVKRSTLEVEVRSDQRTMDAANAFEHDFDGTARCEIPVLPTSRLPSDWLLGIVVGPSGTGKTTTIRNFCKTHDLIFEEGEDPCEGVTVFSHVCEACHSADIAAEVLDACQLPRCCWLSRFGTLSRSESWRAHIASRIAASRKINAQDHVVVIDEFTTQLDRLHAQNLCTALSAYVKRNGVRLLCATVHDDVVPWLCPCWIFDTARAEFACLMGDVPNTADECCDEPQQAPAIYDPTDEFLWEPPVVLLDVQQVSSASANALWQDHFKEHHYLTGSLCPLRDGCFLVRERHSRGFVAFHASSMQPGVMTSVREHRLVVRPEWQGFGIGPKLSNFLAARWRAATIDQNYRFSSRTAHPRLGELRQISPHWAPTCNNLVSVSGDSFGDIGDFGKKVRLPSLVLPHGTVLRVCRGEGQFRVATRAPLMHVKLNVEIPAEEQLSIEQLIGAPVKGSALSIDSLDPHVLVNPDGDKPEGMNWAISKINEESVTSQDEVCQLLRRYAFVDSLILRCNTDTMKSPLRPCQQEAEVDLSWMQARCVAQASLQAELHQVRLLLKELRKSASKRAEKRFSGSGLSVLPRPAIHEVPLKILPALDKVVDRCTPVRKDRICYSHVYVGEEEAADDSAKQWTHKDQYQYWMLTRMPELRAEGYTHQGAIEAAMAEFKQNSVAMFAWPDDSHSLSPISPCRFLGLVLDEECTVIEVEPYGLASQRCITTSNITVSVRAIRRGEKKVSVESLSDLVNGLSTLDGEEGADLLMYLRRKKKIN